MKAKKMMKIPESIGIYIINALRDKTKCFIVESDLDKMDSKIRKISTLTSSIEYGKSDDTIEIDPEIYDFVMESIDNARETTMNFYHEEFESLIKRIRKYNDNDISLGEV